MIWSQKSKAQRQRLANLKNGIGAAADAYNSAYNNAINNYNQRKNAKQWDSSHKDLEWDDDNGWVPKGHKQLRQRQQPCPGAQTAANPYPAITSGAKKASKATKQAAAEVVKSISDTTTEIDGKITRHHRKHHRNALQRQDTAKAGHHRDFPADGGWCAEGR